MGWVGVGGGGWMVGVVCLVAGAGACTRDPPGEAPARAAPGRKAPAGSLLAPGSATYALYYPRGPAVPPAPALLQLLQGTRFKVLGDTGAAVEPTVHAWAPDPASLPPPDAETLATLGRGLAPDERLEVAGARQVFALHFSYPPEGAVQALRAADQVALALAERTQGTLEDLETGEVFTPRAWALLRGQPGRGEAGEPCAHLALRTYRHGAGHRVVSLGMAHFGLPDLCAGEVSGDDLGAAAALLRLALGAALGHPRLAAEGLLDTGLPRPASLPVLVATPLDGEAANRLLELQLTPDLLREAAALRPGRLGPAELAAAARARTALAARRSALPELLADGHRLAVRAAFHGAGAEPEPLWVEVQQVRGRLLVGSLLGAPGPGSALAPGGRVTVDEAQVLDWVLTAPGGGAAGP